MTTSPIHQNTAGDEALLSIYEKRILLARMARSQWKQKRYIKLKDRIVEVEETLSTQMLLRILALDTRLAAQIQKEQRQANANQQASIQDATPPVTEQQEPAEASQPQATQQPAAASKTAPQSPVTANKPKSLLAGKKPKKKNAIKEAFRLKNMELQRLKNAQQAHFVAENTTVMEDQY